jgi:hypothetical protein
MAQTYMKKTSRYRVRARHHKSKQHRDTKFRRLALENGCYGLPGNSPAREE